MLLCYSFSNFVPDHPGLASKSQEQCLMISGNCQCIIMPAFGKVLPFAWHTNTQALTCQHATGIWSTKTFCKLVCQNHPGCCHAHRPTKKLVCQHSDKCCWHESWHVPFLVCFGMPKSIPNHGPNVPYVHARIEGRCFQNLVYALRAHCCTPKRLIYALRTALLDPKTHYLMQCRRPCAGPSRDCFWLCSC